MARGASGIRRATATSPVSAPSPPRLYYMPRTRSSRVLWLLEEIGAPYELTELPGAQRRSAEHLARHPLGRVPALELGDGTVIFESAAICLHLADLNPDAGLIGSVGSPERALAYQWSLFAMTELQAPLFAWIRELGSAPSSPAPESVSPARESVSPARERFAAAATALAAVLDGSGWAIRGRFTVADVLCASVLAGAHSRGLLAQWPGLRSYVERGEARPAYAAAAAIWDRPRS